MKLEPSLETLQQQIELRVLLGPQAGSRLTLGPGDYDLGAGDDCSIILSGPKIQSLHARLSFDGEIPSLTPVEGSICDTQGNEITDTIELELGMPIEIGGIWISVDDVLADWPNPTDVLPLAPPRCACGIQRIPGRKVRCLELICSHEGKRRKKTFPCCGDDGQHPSTYCGRGIALGWLRPEAESTSRCATKGSGY